MLKLHPAPSFLYLFFFFCPISFHPPLTFPGIRLLSGMPAPDLTSALNKLFMGRVPGTGMPGWGFAKDAWDFPVKCAVSLHCISSEGHDVLVEKNV